MLELNAGDGRTIFNMFVSRFKSIVAHDASGMILDKAKAKFELNSRTNVPMRTTSFNVI